MNSPRKKIAVIGGGFVGLCSALQLADAGADVMLIDPGEPERAASFGNACQIAVGEVVPLAVPGVLRSVPKWLMDPLGPLSIQWRYLPRLTPWLLRFLAQARMDRVEAVSGVMAALCNTMKQDYQPLIAAAKAEDLFKPSNYLRVYETEAQWRAEGFKWALRERAGLEYEIARGKELQGLEQDIAGRFGFGVTIKGRQTVINPARLMQSFARLLTERGGRVVAGTATGFDSKGAEITAVNLADGTKIPVQDVVISAGAWSHRLAAKLGDKIPLESERGYHVMLPDPGIRIDRAVSYVAKGMVAVPIETGLRLAGPVEFAGLDAPPNFARADTLVEVAKILFPRLNVSGARPWMGHRPSLPDALPIIDRASRHSNVIYAFGHGHMGLSWAATTGRLVAALAFDRPPNFDLHPFRLSRFSA